jgi:WD40 repeat protein
MAKRRLEDAIVASRALTVGIKLIDQFRSAKNLFSHDVHSNGGVFSLRFSDELDQLAVGYGDGSIRLFSVTNGKETNEYCASSLPPIEHLRRLSMDLPIMSLKWHPLATHRLYAACVDGTIRQVDKQTNQLSVITYEHDNELTSMDFSVDGKHFATVGKDAHIRVYDSEKNIIVHKYNNQRSDTQLEQIRGRRDSHGGDDLTCTTGHYYRAFACKFHPDHKNILLTGGWDNVVKLWDIRQKDAMSEEIAGPHICGEGIDARGNDILTASWTRSNSLQIWDFRTMGLLTTLNVPNADHEKGEFMYSGQLCDNKTVLAAGSGTCACHVINSETNQEIARLPLSKPIYALDSMLGGRVFAFGGLDKFCLAHMKDN